MQTMQELLKWGSNQLQEVNIEEAELDAWLLLEYVTGTNRASYYGNPSINVEENKIQKYREVIERRSQRIPLQHIIGVQEFMGLEFHVNEFVLIPRQDTENLVERVMENLKSGDRVLDMCTGSGCILLSLLKLKPNITGVGVDISKEALQVAEQNARELDVKAEFLESNLFHEVKGIYDVIVSNPPYIRSAVIEELEAEVKLHDPMLALDGMEDGLFFYREIVEKAKEYLTMEGYLYFEIGHDQGIDVAHLMQQAGFSEIQIKKDLAGLDRVVCGRL